MLSVLTLAYDSAALQRVSAAVIESVYHFDKRVFITVSSPFNSSVRSLGAKGIKLTHFLVFLTFKISLWPCLSRMRAL